MPLVRILSEDDYWALRLPLDAYLSDSIPTDEVEAELAIMQERFRSAAGDLGAENTDWEFPGHYQHVRVFYVYLHSQALYGPALAKLIQTTMEGFDTTWAGEFECYEVPGTDGCMLDFIYHKSSFVFCDDQHEDNTRLINALELAD